MAATSIAHATGERRSVGEAASAARGQRAVEQQHRVELASPLQAISATAIAHAVRRAAT